MGLLSYRLPSRDDKRVPLTMNIQMCDIVAHIFILASIPALAHAASWASATHLPDGKAASF
jgi:hypothetical protein